MKPYIFHARFLFLVQHMQDIRLRHCRGGRSLLQFKGGGSGGGSGGEGKGGYDE
jgi:hypothetical protein